MRKLTLLIVCFSLCQLGATQTGEKKNSVGATPANWGDEFVQFWTKKKSSANQPKTGVTGGAAGQDKKTSRSQSSAVSKAGDVVSGGGAPRSMGGASASAGIVATKSPVVVMPSRISPVVATAVPTLATTNLAKSVITKTFYVPPPAPRIALPQIRQEIQRILVLNQRIKSIQGGSATQFRQIQEQALIHQKILNEIEGTQKQESETKTPDKETLLAQEKLRIIHEESKRDAKIMGAGLSAPSVNSRGFNPVKNSGGEKILNSKEAKLNAKINRAVPSASVSGPKAADQIKNPNDEEPLNPEESASEDTDKTAGN